MPLCGFTPNMLRGLTEFAQGLYAQALKRSGEEGISLEHAFKVEVEEMNIFLAELDRRYYEDLRPQYSVTESMQRLVDWADETLSSK